MQAELTGLPERLQLADLVVGCGMRMPGCRDGWVKQQRVIEGLVEKVKRYEEDDRMRDGVDC